MMRTEIVALVWRMLHAGHSPRTISEATGVDLGEVLELQAEMP